MTNNLLSDGTLKVSFVATIGSKSAPTAAELIAGLSLEALLTDFDMPGSTASIDTSSIASTFDTNDVGRRGFGPAVLTLKQQAQLLSGDAVRAALLYRAAGFLVVRAGIDVATAFAAGQEVEVHPVRCQQPMRVKHAPNDIHKYVVTMNVTDDSAPNAIVA